MDTGVPGVFTVEIGYRFRKVPKTFKDLSKHTLGFAASDDNSRGFALHFSTAGIALTRVDDFGVVTPIPGTDEDVAELDDEIRLVRVAVDGVLGRAYVAIGTPDDIGPIRYIVPVEGSTEFVADRFQLFAHGDPSAPAVTEVYYVRMASTLVIPNAPPFADAGQDQTTAVGQAARLDGRASYDVEGLDISYNWTAVDAPFGSVYAAEGAGGSVTDNGDADGYTDRMSYPVGSLPSWVAAGDVLQILGIRSIIVTHDVGTGLIVVENNVIPDSAGAGLGFRVIDQDVLSDAAAYGPYVVPDVQGLFRFELVVNDGSSDSEAAEVLVNVTGSRLPYGVEPDMSFIWKALGDEWQHVEGRTIFEEAWVAAAQLLGSYMFEVWQYHYNYSIKDAQSVLTRRWLPYTTLSSDADPDNAVFELRYGVLLGLHNFADAAPPTSGTSLVVEAYVSGDLDSAVEATIPLSATTIDGLLAEINAGLPPGVEAYAFGTRGDISGNNYWQGPFITTAAGGFTNTFSSASLPTWLAAGDIVHIAGHRYTVDSVAAPDVTIDTTGLAETEWLPGGLTDAGVIAYRRTRIGLRSNSTYFTASGSGALALGIPTGVQSSLSGDAGTRITDKTFFVGEGIDLEYHGINNGDYLSVNNGQVIRILSYVNSTDPMPNQRLLLHDELPEDASAEWRVPGQLVSAATDYATEGVYPGDLIKVEVYDSATGLEHVPTLLVEGVEYRTVIGDLSALYWALEDPDRYELRLIGVKRRKAIPLDEDIVGIPALQDRVSVAAEPEFFRENVDYVIEPFYRASDGSAVPMLQFRDSTFIDLNIDPPDVLWAEYTNFSNDPQVEALFGRLVGFLRDDAAGLGADFNYRAGVAGLMYARRQGPSLDALRIGAQILLGQPFAEVDGYILEVQTDYSPTQGRLLIQDDNGDIPSTSEVIRTYIYSKDPASVAPTSGLDINPDTDEPWAAGDLVPQFSSLGSGVEVLDYLKDIEWVRSRIGSGSMYEIQKFHSYVLSANSSLVNLDAVEVLLDFMERSKTTYVTPFLVVGKEIFDDIDITDDVSFSISPRIVDHISVPNAQAYDNQDGDGGVFGNYDEAVVYDGYQLAPDEIISMLVSFVWGGGTPPSTPDLWPENHDIVDVDGNLGPPGGTFQPTAIQNVPAGNYEYTILLKAAGELHGGDELTYF